jgi:hypothetical protein
MKRARALMRELCPFTPGRYRVPAAPSYCAREGVFNAASEVTRALSYEGPPDKLEVFSARFPWASGVGVE